MKRIYEAASLELDPAMENCVLCGAKTSVPQRLPVQLRKFFVHGCGQLCQPCYYRMKSENNRQFELSNEQLEELLEISAIKDSGDL